MPVDFSSEDLVIATSKERPKRLSIVIEALPSFIHLLPLALPCAIFCIWWLAASHAWISDLILPHPNLVLSTMGEMLASGELFTASMVSLWRVACGMVIGGGLGMVIGIVMARSGTFEAYLGPTLRALWVVPTLGWLPFLMLILGVGEGLKYAMIAKTCFLPMMVTSYEGTRAVPRRYIEVARAMELSRFTTFKSVILPAVLPNFFAGFRLSLSKAWQSLVVVELIASSAGIGYLMNWGRKLFFLDVVIVTMIVIGLTGWALDRLLLIAERRLTFWQLRSVG